MQSKNSSGTINVPVLIPCFPQSVSSLSLTFLAGGMPFIDVPTPISSASSEAASAVVSPSTDSGLEFSSQTTSKEDLTDLEQPGSSGYSTATEPGNSELGVPEQPDSQVWLFSKVPCPILHCRN